MALRSRSALLKKIPLAKLDPLDEVCELMFFGWKGAIRQADEYLASQGLSRVHHRIMYVIARRDGVTVGELHEMLGISKQALHRPMKQLLNEGFAVSVRSPTSHRHKIIRLTAKGKRTEAGASARERAIMSKAFEKVGKAGKTGWIEVMSFVAENN